MGLDSQSIPHNMTHHKIPGKEHSFFSLKRTSLLCSCIRCVFVLCVGGGHECLHTHAHSHTCLISVFGYVSIFFVVLIQAPTGNLLGSSPCGHCHS